MQTMRTSGELHEESAYECAFPESRARVGTTIPGDGAAIIPEITPFRLRCGCRFVVERSISCSEANQIAIKDATTPVLHFETMQRHPPRLRPATHGPLINL